jgi:hypothetical protein
MTLSLILAGVSAVLQMEPVKGLLGNLPSMIGGDKGKRIQYGAVLARQLEGKITRARAVQKVKVAKLNELAAEDNPELLMIHFGLLMERAAEFLLEIEELADQVGDVLEGDDDNRPSR